VVLIELTDLTGKTFNVAAEAVICIDAIAEEGRPAAKAVIELASGHQRWVKETREQIVAKLEGSK
jgi:uncharacterized protein YlzI (FlbEa/FlbD family)